MSIGEHHRLSSQEKRALLAALLRDRPQPGGAATPLSHNQKALWLLHQRSPESSAYNTAFAVRIRSPITPAALRAALQAIVDRHAALRTTFTAEDGKVVATTAAHQALGFTEIDARGWTAERLAASVAADYRQPFDLACGPLLRVSLYGCGPDQSVLLLALHHIVCDAWSMWLLMHELSVLYPAVLEGRPSGLAPVPAQFPEFVAWQDRLLAGAEGEKLWDYWRGRLDGDLPVLELPTDRARPAVQSTHGASHAFQIDGADARSLLEVGKTHGATLYMVLLTAFQVLLHRYTGQDDIIVGSPAAGRSNPDMATCIGYFANVLPLRTDLSGDPTFAAFLSQVRHTVLDALTHQDLPFPLLIERLQPKRDPSRSPVIETMFVLQRPPQSEPFVALLTGADAGRVRWGGLDMEPFPIAQMEGQFDLSWEVVEGPSSLSCVLKYAPELFEADSIRRMEGHLRTLLRAIAHDPEQRISRMPLLTPAERLQVLDQWQGQTVPYRLDRCLHHWVEDQAARTPDAVAVTLAAPDGGELTWRELDVRANQLARRLQRLGIAAGSVIGVLAKRSPALVVGLLGILKAGCAWLPLDPDYPRQRLAFMSGHARIAALLVTGGLANRLAFTAGPVLDLDADWADIAGERATAPPVSVTADDLAYVIYTSGSTGEPKGVENTHRGICNRLLWMQDEYRLDASDSVLQKTPFSFDVSVWEFFWPLMTGARLVLAVPGGHRDRDYLVETIAAHAITTAHFVPSMLQMFLDARDLQRCRVPLRRLICSGEALPASLQQRCFERLPDVALANLYGPTEAAVDVTAWACRPDPGARTVPIGRPIANVRTYLLDRNLQPVPVGVPGELHIGGVAVARGYRSRPDLTAERFIPDTVTQRTDGRTDCTRLYRTGDLCRWLADGSIEYLQRLDFQVKLRGFRIEPGEVEEALCAHPQVREAVVGVAASGADARLLAWIVPRTGIMPEARDLRRFLRDRLPDYMVPGAFVVLEALPLGPTGKVNRVALPVPEAREAAPPPSLGSVERRIAAVWRDVLRRTDDPAIDDNFFDLGGHSLLLAEVQTGLAAAFGRAPAMVEMFQFTTIAQLARCCADPVPQPAAAPAELDAAPDIANKDIAIIGMAGRFPGAGDVETFWRNLCGGVESITVFDEASLAHAGVAEAEWRDPAYVRAFGALAGIEDFDAEFFGFTPRAAELMDVQHRLLLECAWEALEHAGHDPAAEPGRYGLFAGVGMNRYLLNNLLANPTLIAETDPYALMIGNDKDFAATRVAYKLDLRGPCVSVQTACSTSLVAVHMACRSLLAGECDSALAGGCSVTLPQDRGYTYREGMILSPDGHCRAFDQDASGTVGGSGVGIVVLKRLADALAAGDCIHAVIKGSAVNNDGAAKAGYTAPSVTGQSKVIAAALAASGVGADTIGYIEAHGTATPLGDPIEIAALAQVFRSNGDSSGVCAIGSVKTNVGHLDSSAGVAGLIKAALVVKEGVIPPSLHFRTANPALGLSETPFRVAAGHQPWPIAHGPRRAGVSSFGIGGTNAHVVLEQPPMRSLPGAVPALAREWHLLTLSAPQPAALDAVTARLAGHLLATPDLDLADVACTLAQGRRSFRYRRTLVCRSGAEAADALERAAAGDTRTTMSPVPGTTRSVAFMFSGQGAQHVGMAADIYREEPVFRDTVDHCADVLLPLLGLDLRGVIGIAADADVADDRRLRQTALAQPALFTVEYALARLWTAWGVRPDALIGHSLGEYVAACLAGVWEPDDALRLVAHRAALMQRQPAGGMLAVSLSEAAVLDGLPSGLSLAAVNGPASCVVAGAEAMIFAFAEMLAARDVACRVLATSHAFHSAMMESAIEPFLDELRRVPARAPIIPFVSNVTGTWITPEQATDPTYWARHLREPVRFADGLGVLLEERGRCLVEVGPGNTLATLAGRHPGRSSGQTVVHSLPRSRQETPDAVQLLGAAGQLWAAGVALDWTQLHAGRRRVPLPTYPFQRQRYWIDPPRDGDAAPVPLDRKRVSALNSADRRTAIEDWFYVPSWHRTRPCSGEPAPGSHWLLFMDDCGVGTDLAAQLRQRNVNVTQVYAASTYTVLDPQNFELDPGSDEDHRALAETLWRSECLPDVVVHLWNVAPQGAGASEPLAARDRSFHSLVSLARALSERAPDRPCHVAVVSSRLHNVTGEEVLDPNVALLLGPVAVIPQEFRTLSCSSVDIDLQPRYRPRHIEHLLRDAAIAHGQTSIAYRGGHRWEQIFAPAPLPAQPLPVRPGSVWLITGGAGGIGLALAERLARSAPNVGLALLGRSPLTTAVPPAGISGGTAHEWPDLGAMTAEFGAMLARHTSERIEHRPVVQDMERGLDRLCLALITDFLRDADIEFRPGCRYARDELRQRLRVAPRRRRFFDRLLGILVEDGVLADLPGDDVAVDRVPPADLASRVSFALCERFPELAPVDALLRRCAAQLGPVLSETQGAIGMLYPDGTLDLYGAERPLGNTLSERTAYIAALCDFVRHLRARSPERVPRILEVGGGSGELTLALMRALEGTAVEYCFTDISRAIVLAAQRQAAVTDLPNITFAVLDISRDPLAQGFDLERYDLVVGLDVVHAARRIDVALGQLHRLVAPGGFLCLLESTRPQRHLDLIWGFAEGWWHFEDHELRQHSPLLNIAQWTAALTRCGFHEVAAWPEDAEQIAAEYGLIVAQRERRRPEIPSDFDNTENFDNAETQAERLRRLGADVLLLQADVADPAQMQRALADINAHFGRLDGVIHAAGIAGGGTIEVRTRKDSEREFEAKVDGCRVLAEALGDTPLDAFVLCSSVTSTTGGFGQAAYSAACAFQDAFAEARALLRPGERVIAIDWDRWRNLGMATMLEARHRALTGEELDGGMCADEALEAFGRILSAGAPRVIVSTRDFPALVEQSRSWQLGRIAEQMDRQAPKSHPRPHLAQVYIAPRGDTEQRIADVWQEELGIEGVGANDDFFALGGDSLIAIKMTSRLRKVLPVPLDVRALYAAPTVASLAEHVASLLWAAQDPALELTEDGDGGVL